MRNHPEEGIDALFVDDVPGGCLIACSCGTEFVEKSNNYGNITLCPTCLTEVCYRPWYEW